MKNAQALQELLTPTITAMGYELWGCLYIPQGRHALLRIYIDSENGITVDDCELVSRQVSAVLDVEDPITGAYSLEVSSPGLDRPLFTKAQFNQFVGAKINVRLHLPIENRRHISGYLNSVVGDEIFVKVNEQEFKVALTNIAKAHVLPENLLSKKDGRGRNE